MAHKKAAGSVKNLRDSQPKYRGVKVFGGQSVLAGNIVIRQKWSKYECGKNTYEAADFTIHAAIDGVVAFKKKNFKKFNGRTYLKTVVEVLSNDEVQAEVKKAPAKKAAPKKEEAKAEVKKAPTKKAAPKKEEAKAEVKKAPTKKAAPKKEEAKAEVKKAPTKKAAPKKEEAKAEVKKASAKKAAPKKEEAKKEEK